MLDWSSFAFADKTIERNRFSRTRAVISGYSTMARLAVGPVLIDAWSPPAGSINCIALTLCSSIREPSIATMTEASAAREAFSEWYILLDDDDDDGDMVSRVLSFQLGTNLPPLNLVTFVCERECGCECEGGELFYLVGLSSSGELVWFGDFVEFYATNEHLLSS